MKFLRSLPSKLAGAAVNRIASKLDDYPFQWMRKAAGGHFCYDVYNHKWDRVEHCYHRAMWPNRKLMTPCEDWS